MNKERLIQDHFMSRFVEALAERIWFEVGTTVPHGNMIGYERSACDLEGVIPSVFFYNKGPIYEHDMLLPARSRNNWGPQPAVALLYIQDRLRVVFRPEGQGLPGIWSVALQHPESVIIIDKEKDRLDLLLLLRRGYGIRGPQWPKELETHDVIFVPRSMSECRRVFCMGRLALDARGWDMRPQARFRGQPMPIPKALIVGEPLIEPVEVASITVPSTWNSVKCSGIRVIAIYELRLYVEESRKKEEDNLEKVALGRTMQRSHDFYLADSVPIYEVGQDYVHPFRYDPDPLTYDRWKWYPSAQSCLEAWTGSFRDVSPFLHELKRMQ